MKKPENFESMTLEEKKLALEVAHMNRPWWKKPNYLSILVPGVLGATTVIIAFATNLIENKVSKYEENIEEVSGREDKLMEEIEAHKLELYNDSIVHLNEMAYADSLQTDLKKKLDEHESMLEEERASLLDLTDSLSKSNHAYADQVEAASSQQEKIRILNSQVQKLTDKLATATGLYDQSRETIRKGEKAHKALTDKFNELDVLYRKYRDKNPPLTPEERMVLQTYHQQKMQQQHASAGGMQQDPQQ